MMKVLMFCTLLVSAATATAQQTVHRYAFVDADCKAGFSGITGEGAKRIVSEIMDLELAPAALITAETDLGTQFRAAVDRKYPGSLNQFNGVYVYLFNDADAARKRRDEMISDYRSAEIALLEFPMKP
jgi:hypothetical protein